MSRRVWIGIIVAAVAILVLAYPFWSAVVNETINTATIDKSCSSPEDCVVKPIKCSGTVSCSCRYYEAVNKDWNKTCLPSISLRTAYCQCPQVISVPDCVEGKCVMKEPDSLQENSRK